LIHRVIDSLKRAPAATVGPILLPRSRLLVPMIQ